MSFTSVAVAITTVCILSFVVSFIVAQLNKPKEEEVPTPISGECEDVGTIAPVHYAPTHNPFNDVEQYDTSVTHNARKPWTEDQEQTLAALAGDGADINEIAYILGRSVKATERRMATLGITQE